MDESDIEKAAARAVAIAEQFRGPSYRITDKALTDIVLSAFPAVDEEELRRVLIDRGVISHQRSEPESIMERVVEAPPVYVDERALVESVARLFEPIVGYEDVKDLFWRALTSDRPVHILLEGPPASAKTLFLMEVANLPGSHYAVGGGTTKAGLTQALLTFRPRYLLIDEIETVANPKDYSALLHLMENQEVVETKYGRHVRLPLTTWVFAAGNNTPQIPPALLSRFGGRAGILRFKEYTTDEFVDVATSVLVKRESVPEDHARRIAQACLGVGTRDIRFAVRLARLTKTEEDLVKVVETMRRRR